MDGLLDPSLFTEEQLRRLAQQALATHPADAKAPLVSGLMAAGLGMLANAHKGLAGGVGEGGLLGMQAFNQAKQAQQKDPMAQINAMGALQGLYGQAQSQKWTNNFLGQGGPQQPPQQMGPPADLAQNFVGPPQEQPSAPPMPPPAQGATMNPMDVMRGVALGNPLAKEVYSTQFKPFELSQGQNRYVMGPDGKPQLAATNVDPGKPVYDPTTKTAAFVPGAAEDLARAEALKTRGSETEKAALEPLRIADGKGGWLMIRKSNPINDAEIATALQNHVKSLGLPPLDPSQIPQTGRGMERAPETIKAAEASAVLPPAAQTAMNTDFIDKEYRPTQERARANRERIARLDTLDNLKMDTGWGTSAKVYGARVLEGLGMAPESAKNAAIDATVFNQALMTEMWQLLVAQKGVQTEGDAKRAQATFAQLDNPVEANKFVNAFSRAVLEQENAKAKFYSQHIGGKVKSGDPYTLEAEWQAQQKSIFDHPALAKFKGKDVATANQQISPQDWEAEAKRRGLVR
jgi:hypothetical protein